MDGWIDGRTDGWMDGWIDILCLYYVDTMCILLSILYDNTHIYIYMILNKVWYITELSGESQLDGRGAQ